MSQYIVKDALLEYLNKLYEKHSTPNSVDEGGVVINDIEYFLDTLEVKEVDLEKEIDNYLNPIEAWQIQEAPFSSMAEIAKHFFELGIKVQKGVENEM